MSCTCDRYQLVAPDGSVLEGERVRDPNCREHGFPTDQWPANHPLRRHARRIVVHPAYQSRDWRGRFSKKREAVMRIETPRETEERLYRESLSPTTRAAG